MTSFTKLSFLAVASLFALTFVSATESYAGTQILACEFDVEVDLTLTCGDGYLINVTHGFFGRDDTTTCAYNTDVDTLPESTYCHAPQALKNYGTLCNGKQSCTVMRTNALAGQPVHCPNDLNRYIRVDYTCEKKIYNALVCEASGILPLSCPEGQVIVPMTAFYGRRPGENDKCYHVNSTVTEECSTDTALATFEWSCDGRRQCDVDARNTEYGDPCPGVFKYLELEFTCAVCRNEHVLDWECDMWAWSGECESNPDFMMPFCRRSCGHCQSCKPLCMNYELDDDCEAWAWAGECTGENSAWMNARCYKSCSGCASVQASECVNAYHNDTACNEWASWGECDWNAQYMLNQCWAACTANCTNIDVSNRLGDDVRCVEWVLAGECQVNPDFMYQQCSGACIGATDWACHNLWENSTQCALWNSWGDCEAAEYSEWMWANCQGACQGCEPRCENAAGEVACFGYLAENQCSANPGWMYQNCWKSCSGCEPETENIHDDGDCFTWAQAGECATNPLYMYENCGAECRETVVANRLAVTAEWTTSEELADATCEMYRRWGECQNNAPWMDLYCKKACTQYYKPAPMEVCEDLMEECDAWADDGQCYWNPSHMLPHCTSCCLMCGPHDLPEGFIGQWNEAGDMSDLTYQMTFMMPEVFPRATVLTHFTGFFTTTDEVNLEVWTRETDGSYSRKWQTTFSADAPNTAQTVMAPACWAVEEGDKIGFSAPTRASPIAMFTGPETEEPRMVSYRPYASNGPFSTMEDVYFSFSAGYAESDYNCDEEMKRK